MPNDDYSRFYDERFVDGPDPDDYTIGGRHRIDPDSNCEVLVARYRASQRCYKCKNTITQGGFAPSRILKRDYECRRCNTKRRNREKKAARAIKRRLLDAAKETR